MALFGVADVESAYATGHVVAFVGVPVAANADQFPLICAASKVSDEEPLKAAALLKT